MHGILRQVHYAKRWFEEKAGEHAGRNNDPFRGLLRSQKVSHFELLVEEVLRASFADHVVVNAELPGEVSFDFSGERGTGKLELDAPTGHEARAADHGIELSEDRGECGFGVLL